MNIEEARKHLKKNLNNWKKSKKDNGYMPEIMEEINTDYEAIETLLTAYEKEKEKKEKLEYEELEANEYIKELRKYIEKNKIRIPMPEEYQKPKNWGEEVTIQTKEYISKDKIKEIIYGDYEDLEIILRIKRLIDKEE